MVDIIVVPVAMAMMKNIDVIHAFIKQNHSLQLQLKLYQTYHLTLLYSSKKIL
jgi:hypothetical protein